MKALIKTVEKPQHSNVKGNHKLIAHSDRYGNWVAASGKYLLHIDARDVVSVWEIN